MLHNIFAKRKKSIDSIHIDAMTIIAADDVISGDIKVNAAIHIDGEINVGSLVAKRVSIGRGGIVKGKITADHVLVSGLCQADITADTVELIKGSRFIGDIASKYLMIEENAVFIGNKGVI